MHEVILKQFDHPDEIRTLENNKFEPVHLGGMTIGRATYKPGDVFYIEPGHDSWVIGHEPYVSVHFMGAGAYAVKPPKWQRPTLLR